MHITSLKNIPGTKMDMEGAVNVIKQIPISKADGTPSFSFRVFTIGPGGHTPLHAHPFEHLNYVIEGKGMVVNDNDEHPVNKGDFIMILPGERHQYKNTSTKEEFVIICAVPKEYE